MKHAFLILTYKHYDQLKVLLKLLDHEDADIFIHADKTDTGFNEQDFENICQYSKVTMIPRIDVAWGDYTQELAEMNLIQAALNADEHYDYFHFISGMDLPIKSMDHIMKFFEEHNGEIFVECNDVLKLRSEFRFMLRYDVYHLFQKHIGKGRTFIKGKRWLKYIDFGQCILQHIFGVSRTRKMVKNGITIKGGSQWFSIPRYFAEYINNDRENILKFCHDGYCLDEVFMATWLYNSPYYDRIYRGGRSYDSSLRRYKWVNFDPTMVTIGDIKEYDKEDDAIFARKFAIEDNPEVVKFLLKRNSKEF